MLSIASFLKLLRESFRDLLPIILVIMFFQLIVIQTVPDNWLSTSIGLAIVGVGLAVFLLGLEVGIFPVGEGLASDFAHKGSTGWIMLFAFMIGFGTTVAEPALIVIADKAASISSGRIDATVLRIVVAFSVGFAIIIGVWRIIKGHPIHYYIISGYVMVVATTAFAPKEIVALAYDLGGVTTSTVTVPLVAALGIGLASTIKGRNPVLDGFGLIAFASLTPMIFVQFYGIFVYQFVEVSAVIVPQSIEAIETVKLSFALVDILKGLAGVIGDVLPILAVILFFQYLVLKKHIDNLKEVIIGFGLVILGLYAFIVGLEMGLFSVGETMAMELTKYDSNLVIYSFGFLIGFSTTMAEPSLTAIARKAKEISDGKINDFALRLFVALGVAIGIAIGSYRIVVGGEIVYYIMTGYMLVIFLTFMAPKYIIPIAYDSGGVTTSTVTVPLVAAIGLGLATNIPGRDPLIDGFGLIAFASLFPMITVMLYGVITEEVGVKGQHELEEIHLDEIRFALGDVNDMELSTVRVQGTTKQKTYKMPFSAVHIIVPRAKKEEALLAAKDSGATGVTIMEAHGMGLDEMDNFYNRLESQATDVNLMLIVPTKKVNQIIRNVMHKLDIIGNGDGISYSYPISNLKGLTLKESDL
ncbi:Nitrogen regulatory protein P-II [Epsilonproteobacteria bacterium SCGC AD-308-O04]|mgnify:CR=1 FL=1|jgi:nitrogen regulatory protein PII|nr:Nitrogen regulatory protein P-II [Epsilonproteobacteria bacterium SCGC AD-308-O04]